MSDFLGRTPAAVVVDRRGAEPAVVHVHSGRSTFDRPDVEDLLGVLDRLRDG